VPRSSSEPIGSPSLISLKSETKTKSRRLFIVRGLFYPFNAFDKQVRHSDTLDVGFFSTSVPVYAHVFLRSSGT